MSADDALEVVCQSVLSFADWLGGIRFDRTRDGWVAWALNKELLCVALSGTGFPNAMDALEELARVLEARSEPAPPTPQEPEGAK